MDKKILIVDDDCDILEPLELILESEGFKVDTTDKGKFIYTKIADFKPDLLLLDILMSGSDGRDICRTLKNDKKNKDLIVIMMSAHPTAAQDSTDIGANDFIAKPFETADLLSMIDRNLKRTLHA